MKKNEELFRHFLELLEKDKQDKYAGFLFQFIEHVLESTMLLGKEGYAPAINITLYAKQTGQDVELIFRPSKIGSVEIHQKLQLDKLNEKLKTALREYGQEVWDMNPFNELVTKKIDFDPAKAWKGAMKIVDENK